MRYRAKYATGLGVQQIGQQRIKRRSRRRGIWRAGQDETANTYVIEFAI